MGYRQLFETRYRTVAWLKLKCTDLTGHYSRLKPKSNRDWERRWHFVWHFPRLIFKRRLQRAVAAPRLLRRCLSNGFGLLGAKRKPFQPWWSSGLGSNRIRRRKVCWVACGWPQQRTDEWGDCCFVLPVQRVVCRNSLVGRCTIWIFRLYTNPGICLIAGENWKTEGRGTCWVRQDNEKTQIWLRWRR